MHLKPLWHFGYLLIVRAASLTSNLFRVYWDYYITACILTLGVRVYAIFGFCGIHHFQDINQKLGNDVLVFVNRIAEIVHSRYCSFFVALFCIVLYFLYHLKLPVCFHVLRRYCYVQCVLVYFIVTCL